MTMRTLCIAISCVAVTLCGSIDRSDAATPASTTTSTKSAGSVRIPAYERVQLPNGIVVLLMERHEVPLVSFQAIVRGGAVTDPDDKAGLANLLASLLEKGAGARDALRFAETIAAVGGQIQTGAGLETLVVNGSFLARDQALMIDLLADMLQRPTLDAAQFEALRARHIEFFRAAKDSDLDSFTSLYAASAVFGAHPYSHSVSGSEAGLAAISHADVTRAFREQIGADRLIIAVAGDFKTAQMRDRVSRAFAGMRKADAPLPKLIAAPRLTGRRVLLIDAPESAQSYFHLANVGVGRKDQRRAPIDVVNALFGGRFTSMLNTELRIKSGLSYGASSRFERNLNPGMWAVASFTRTETTVQAIDLALDVLDKLHQNPPDPTALDSGKSYVQGQFPLALETAGQWAFQLATLELYGLPREYIDGYSAALGAVTATDAQRTIDEVFPKSDQLAIVVIGKAEAIRDGLKKYGEVTEMKLSDPSFVARSP
jgi:zinc protease